MLFLTIHILANNLKLFSYLGELWHPIRFHILFITLHMLMNIHLIISYVNKQYPRNHICYLSPFSSYFTIVSYLDEHVSLKFIAYFTLSVAIYHTSYLIYQTHILANSYVIYHFSYLNNVNPEKHVWTYDK